MFYLFKKIFYRVMGVVAGPPASGRVGDPSDLAVIGEVLRNRSRKTKFHSPALNL